MNVLLRDSRLGIHNPEQMVVTAYAPDDHASSGQTCRTIVSRQTKT